MLWFKNLFKKKNKLPDWTDIISQFQKPKKVKVILGEMVKICPSKKHAWFESNVGLIRKQI